MPSALIQRQCLLTLAETMRGRVSLLGRGFTPHTTGRRYAASCVIARHEVRECQTRANFHDRGHLTVAVQFDRAIRRGCVSMTNGWWISQGGTVNFLSLGRETDMGHGAAFHDNLVAIERG